jgi:hypothetical protein
MKRTKKCKHCHGFFEARRSNHVYCSASCKTKASYKRNHYKYISGHYQKTNALVESEGLSKPVNTTVVETMKILENKIDRIQEAQSINGVSVTNAAMGAATSDAAVFAIKKMFAPNTLPATKGDILILKNELNELKKMIQSVNSTKTQFFNV